MSGSHPEDVDDLSNTGTTSTTQPYSATAAKDVENLFRKVILMLEKAAILKNCRWSRKIKIQIPHSQKYMI